MRASKAVKRRPQTGVITKPKGRPMAPAKTGRRAARGGAAAGPTGAPGVRSWATGKASPAPAVPVGLSEEDAIRSAKLTPREMPRVFEEEQFTFPETYRVNRVRLLVRDPDWLFAYWDVDPASIEALVAGIGERAAELSRLTLRVSDPRNGGSTNILLPEGARWWYIRTDALHRSYRAEIGVTLPSGAFELLAVSNTVTTPRVGPSPLRAHRVVDYRETGLGGGIEEEILVAPPLSIAPGPTGGALVSDVRRTPGASEAFRPGGASDSFSR